MREIIVTTIRTAAGLSLALALFLYCLLIVAPVLVIDWAWRMVKTGVLVTGEALHRLANGMVRRAS